MKHTGGCHCGRVRFEVAGEADLVVYDCNCSICRKCAYLHYIVPRSRFDIMAGTEDLVSYKFNTAVADHLFCRVCGIKSFYVPRSHPDGVSVNARSIDAGTVTSMRIEPFDGAHWEQSMAALAARDE